MSVNRLNGSSNNFESFVSKGSRAGKGGQVGASSTVASTGAKSSAQENNQDILSISSLVGAAGGAATQVTLGGGSVAPTVAVNALKGAAAELSKSNREELTISELAQQLVDQMYAA